MDAGRKKRWIWAAAIVAAVLLGLAAYSKYLEYQISGMLRAALEQFQAEEPDAQD